VNKDTARLSNPKTLDFKGENSKKKPEVLERSGSKAYIQRLLGGRKQHGAIFQQTDTYRSRAQKYLEGKSNKTDIRDS
jgi:hypothetical protein